MASAPSYGCSQAPMQSVELSFIIFEIRCKNEHGGHLTSGNSFG